MVLAWSASSVASVCGRVAVPVVVNRSSLVPRPYSLRRPFETRGFLYSTATERLKSDQTLRRVINSEIKDAFEADDHDEGESVGGFPFKTEDSPGYSRTVTVTREQIRVEVTRSLTHQDITVTTEKSVRTIWFPTMRLSLLLCLWIILRILRKSKWWYLMGLVLLCSSISPFTMMSASNVRKSFHS